MASNGFNKINDALKKAAEEKGKAFKREDQPAVIAPIPAAEKQNAYKEIPTPEATKTERSAVYSGISKKIVTYHSPTGSIAEQFRAVKTHIFSTDRAETLKIIAITSPANGEGKTIAAINLAIVTAQDSGKPVLLIDCNLRKPSVASLLGISGDRGIGDILCGNARLSEEITATDIKNLSVLTVGQINCNATELLNSQKIKDLLSEARRMYGYVIIDMPAVIPYSDPRILGPLVDGVVIVIRAGRTRREVIARAESILKSVGVNVLGYVLTGVEYHIPEYIHRHL